MSPHPYCRRIQIASPELSLLKRGLGDFLKFSLFRDPPISLPLPHPLQGVFIITDKSNLVGEETKGVGVMKDEGVGVMKDLDVTLLSDTL